MRPLRVIHAADCHLDAPSRSLAREVRERVEQSARTAVERLVALAVDREADALLLAGDLFDRDLVRIPTELWLPEVLGEATAAGVTVIAVTGNHDPGGGAGPLDRIGWPTAAVPPDPRSRRRARSSCGGPTASWPASSIAAGHETPRERDNLVATFPPFAADVPVIGLVHCQVHGYEGEHDRYAPCTVADLAGSRLRLLGARPRAHRDRRLERAAGLVRRLPAGPALRRDRRRRAPSTSSSAPTARRSSSVPLAPVRWQELVLDDLSGIDDTRALVAHCERRFDALARERGVLPGQDWVLRVRLTAARPSTPSCAAPRRPTTSPSPCASGCRSSTSRSATTASRRPSTSPSTRASRTCSAPRSS